MRRALGSLVAATAMVGLSTVAVADGMPSRYAAPAYTSWSGFYIGGSVGWRWTDVDWNFPAPIANQITSTSQSFDHGVLGGHVGYQHQFGAIVVGIEGGAKIAPRSAQARRESSRCAFPLPFEDRCDTENVEQTVHSWRPARLDTYEQVVVVRDRWLRISRGGYRNSVWRDRLCHRRQSRPRSRSAVPGMTAGTSAVASSTWSPRTSSSASNISTSISTPSDIVAMESRTLAGSPVRAPFRSS